MIQVYRIPMPKERLRAMSKDERGLLLLLGYAENQLSMSQKLLNFATNRTPEAEVEQHATDTQMEMLARLMVRGAQRGLGARQHPFHPKAPGKGLLWETGLRRPANLRRAQAAIRRIKSSERRPQPNYAFHYPRSDKAEETFEATFNDRELDNYRNLYFSQHGFNSLFFLSDLIFVDGIGRKANRTDFIDEVWLPFFVEVPSV